MKTSCIKARKSSQIGKSSLNYITNLVHVEVPKNYKDALHFKDQNKCIEIDKKELNLFEEHRMLKIADGAKAMKTLKNVCVFTKEKEK